MIHKTSAQLNHMNKSKHECELIAYSQ